MHALVNTLKDRVYHAPPPALYLHGAVKNVLLPGFYGPFHITLVKKGEMQRSGIVNHLYLNQFQSFSDAGQPGMLRRHGGNAHTTLQRGLSHIVNLPSVLVVAGVPGQQVAGGGQTQLFQFPGPGLPHARERSQRGGAGNIHGGGLLSELMLYFTTAFCGSKGEEWDLPPAAVLDII